MLNVTIAAKSKEAYSIFFDGTYNEAVNGRGSFIRPNAGSLYRLGTLAGRVLHFVPNEMIVLTIQVKGGRDIVAAYNFFELAAGTKIVANLINVPSSDAGDRVIAAIESSLAGFKNHFGGTKEPAPKKGRAASKPAATAKRTKPAAPAKSAKKAPAPAKSSKPPATGKAAPAKPAKKAPARAVAKGATARKKS